MRCTGQKSGFTLMEILVAVGMLSLIFLVIQQPLSLILTYPQRTVHERTDRVAGRLAYSKLHHDFREAFAATSWSKTTDDGKLHILLPLLARFDDADSDGRWDYALWVYDPKAQTLSRGRWSQEELSKKGVPAPRQEPTQQEWEKYFGVSLVLVASSVQEFQFGPPPPPDTGLRLSFKIKNPARSGRTDEYVLQLEESP